MEINERIENLKPYFQSFNVIAEDDASYVLMRFPGNWLMPDEKMLKEVYLVEIASRPEGIYFFTEIKNGMDKLFGCAEFVVQYNKNIEERKYLLKERMNELTKIFASEKLERLKTLRFEMDDIEEVEESEEEEEVAEEVKKPKEEKKGKKTPKKTKEEEVEEILSKSITENAKESEPETTDDGDSGLMAFAKGLTGE